MALDIQPTFQVEKVTGNFHRMVTVLEETHKTRNVGGVERTLTTRKMKQVREDFTEGFMIYYPQGHSLFVAADDEDQLMFLGVMNDPKKVDMESGEEVPDDFALSPKEIVERKQRNRPRASTQGGIAAALGD
jgi:hypothetical protein